MATLSPDEQALYDWLKSGLPSYLFGIAYEEIWGSAVRALNRARVTAAEWIANTYILDSSGAWLEQHAIDRGTRKQFNESDAALQYRLRNIPDALTHGLLEAAATAIVNAGSVAGQAQVVELRRDKIYLVDRQPSTGTGGVFRGPFDGVMRFTPTAGWYDGRPPFTTVEDALTFRLQIASATAPANNGTFIATGMDGDAVLYTNGSGVAADPDASAAWTVHRYDRRGNQATGYRSAFLSRGYRVGTQQAAIVVILPYGTTEGTRLAVLEMLRQKKAAGILAIVERRLSP